MCDSDFNFLAEKITFLSLVRARMYGFEIRQSCLFCLDSIESLVSWRRRKKKPNLLKKHRSTNPPWKYISEQPISVTESCVKEEHIRFFQHCNLLVGVTYCEHQTVVYLSAWHHRGGGCSYMRDVCLCPWNGWLNLQQKHAASIPPAGICLPFMSINTCPHGKHIRQFLGSVWLANRVITCSPLRRGLEAGCKWQMWHVCIHHACR